MAGQPQTQPQQQASQPTKPAQDNRQRLYLYVGGATHEENSDVLEFLAQYADDDDEPNPAKKRVRKVAEIRLDRLTDQHVIIPVVRNIHADKKVEALLPNPHKDGRDLVKYVEKRGPIRECKGVAVADFYTFGEQGEAGDASFDGRLDEGELVNAIGRVCMPAAPRVERRGDGQGNHVRWLVLRWG